MRPPITTRLTDGITRHAPRLAALALAALLYGCADDGVDGAAQQNGDTEEPPRLNVVEPQGQRSPYGNYLTGRFAEKRRDFGRAASALTRALEENPDDIALMRRTFFLTLEAGQTETALKLAHRLEAAGTRFPTVQLLLVAESFKKNDFQGAIRQLETMQREDLARYAVPLALAWSHAGAGETEGALSALSALDSESGFALLRHLHEGFINDIASRTRDAETAYRGAMGNDPASAPNRVVRAYGVFLERQDRSSEAASMYQSYGGEETDNLLFGDALKRVAEKKAPEPLVGNAREGLAESYFDIASILPKERAGEFVLVYVRMALYLRPDFPLAQLLMGDVFDEFGSYREAVEVYQAIDPDSAYGWVARLRLADDFYDLGMVEPAVRLLREMSNERPDRSDAPIRLGNILRYQERYDEAVSAYDDAEKRLGDIKRDDWTLLYSRGIALERSGQWERAEQDFLQALKLQPDQPFVLNYLGYSWVEKGKNLDRAKGMLERAVEQRKDDGYIVDSMGWALYKLGDYRGAVMHLERAVALRPQDPVINDHLGDAYWRVGRAGEARIQWKRVLGLDPDEALRLEIRAKLKDGPAQQKNTGAGG